MKKILVLGIILLMTSCGSKIPSIDEVEKAIENGTVTVEDAYEKGWVDDEWMENYKVELEANSVPALNKLENNVLLPFETTTLTGETFTNDNLSDVTYFAFINPNTEDGKTAYSILQDNYDEIKQLGADVLCIATGEENIELFEDAKFATIFYDDNFKEALGKSNDMVNLDGFCGTSNVKGGFPAAWYMKAEKDIIITNIEGAISLVN